MPEQLQQYDTQLQFLVAIHFQLQQLLCTITTHLQHINIYNTIATYQLQHTCNTITTIPHLNCNTYVHVFSVHEIATIYNYHTIATYVPMTTMCMQLQLRQHTNRQHVLVQLQHGCNTYHHDHSDYEIATTSQHSDLFTSTTNRVTMNQHT